MPSRRAFFWAEVRAMTDPDMLDRDNKNLSANRSRRKLFAFRNFGLADRLSSGQFGDATRQKRQRALMRIALVAPLAEAVPPKLYGGTERVVSWLSEELVRQGHRVVLFASAESNTKAELIACAPQSLRLAGIRDYLSC